jgi:hypothetical protein
MATKVDEHDNLCVWLNYSCSITTVSIGIEWIGSHTFNIAILNFDMSNENKHELKWEFQHKDINLFKNVCGPEELHAFNQAIRLIPEYAIFNMNFSLKK